MIKLKEKFVLIIGDLFSHLKEEKIDYVILRNFDNLPTEVSRDIDFLVRNNDVNNIMQFLRNSCKLYGVKIVHAYEKYCYTKVILGMEMSDNDMIFLQIDFFSPENYMGIEYYDENKLFSSKETRNDYFIPSLDFYCSSLILTAFLNGHMKDRYIRVLHGLLNDKVLRQKVVKILKRVVPSGVANKMVDKILKKRMNGNIKNKQYVFFFMLKNILNRPLRSAYAFFNYITGHLKLIISPPGKFVVFIGPDGSGKTSTVERLFQISEGVVYNKCKYNHGNFLVLPELKVLKKFLLQPKRDKTDLDGCTQENMLLDSNNKELGANISSLRKLVYIIYYGLNNFLYKFKLIFLKKNNYLVVSDRYYYDYFYQKDYAQTPVFIIRLFLKIIPKPDLTIYLSNEGEVIFKRKQDIDLNEIKRQQKRINSNLKYFNNVVKINTNKPIDKVADEVLMRIIDS